MNRFDLSNRTAIVTGGAQGLGFGIAKRFIESGAEVIIWDIVKELLKSAEKKLNSNKATFQSVNVASFEDVKKNIDQITAEKKIDILINNAGVTGLTAKLWDYPTDEWHKVLNVNLNGTFYCCKAIVPHMIKESYGTIINIGSTASLKGYKNGSIYASSTFAVRCLTQCWQSELRPHNIRVCQINPSEVTTAFGNPKRIEREEIYNKLTPNEISHAIISAIEMNDRGLINELNVWATNPFN